MSSKYLLDTNTLSEPARPIPNINILGKLNIHKSKIAVASIVVHELLYGYLRLPESIMQDTLWNYIQKSVLNLSIFNYDLTAAQWHDRKRSRLSKIGKTPAFADGQIASIAFCNNLILVTENVSDCDIFNDLIIENWFIGSSES